MLKRMISLFQTASGAWHFPSILMVASYVIGTLVTGGFICANLRVNRADRIRAFEKELEDAKLKSGLSEEVKILKSENGTLATQSAAIKQLLDDTVKAHDQTRAIAQAADTRTGPQVVSEAFKAALLTSFGGEEVVVQVTCGADDVAFADEVVAILNSKHVSAMRTLIYLPPIPRGISLGARDKAASAIVNKFASELIARGQPLPQRFNNMFSKDASVVIGIGRPL